MGTDLSLSPPPITLPFEEAKTFFQNKLNIPTAKWDDLWKDQHAKGFMSAGAYKADLLADLRSAVDRVHSEGMTLPNFRREFGGIVSRRGWSHEGSRKWRSELIYNTNIRQSYNAGRWAQATDPEILEVMPYIRYRHGDSRVPRPQHLAWDGVTLPPDHPWWKTHGPKNGWGCTCYVENATREEFDKAQAAGKGTAPPSPIDPKTGEPVGIDKGWGYNVGEAAKDEGYRVLLDKFEALPYDIGHKWMNDYLKSPTFERFFEGKIKGDFPVAVLSPEDRNALGSKTHTVWLSSESMLKNRENHPDIALKEYGLLPEIIADGEAYRQGNERMIYLKQGDKYYRAALKTTKEKSGNFMLSLFETTSEKAKKQVVKKYDRIR
ncbi:MAG TPA: phage minor head protein [Acidobacteriota bacterium]|nr:phage minor head protein [Acidobacteriota bacterium]